MKAGQGLCPLLYPYSLELCPARGTCVKIFVERKDDIISLGWGTYVCHVQSSIADSDSSRGGIPLRYDWVSSFLLLDGKPKDAKIRRRQRRLAWPLWEGDMLSKVQ